MKRLWPNAEMNRWQIYVANFVVSTGVTLLRRISRETFHWVMLPSFSPLPIPHRSKGRKQFSSSSSDPFFINPAIPIILPSVRPGGQSNRPHCLSPSHRRTDSRLIDASLFDPVPHFGPNCRMKYKVTLTQFVRTVPIGFRYILWLFLIGSKSTIIIKVWIA